MRKKSRKLSVRLLGFIFRAWRRHPQTGEIIWAKDHGLKAWKIPVSGNVNK